MSARLTVFPFDPVRQIGTVCEVGPTFVRANLPKAAEPKGQWLHGLHLPAGEVGDFVVVELSGIAIFGRIILVKLPERDRLTVEPGVRTQSEPHPVGTIQLLTSISLKDSELLGGVTGFPRLGAAVYSAHPDLVRWVAEVSGSKGSSDDRLTLHIAAIPEAGDAPVLFTPEQILGCHCAVLGATGSGKSWTVARLVEQTAEHASKVILFDATGEFHKLDGAIHHVHVGADRSPQPKKSTEVSLPYSNFTESDLFALFRPSGQSQGPKLRAAIKSLKLIRLVPKLATNGLLRKAQQRKVAVETAQFQQSQPLERADADFDIDRLCQQIEEECVYPSAGSRSAPDYSMWGDMNEAERGYCVSLINRISGILGSTELACVFRPGTAKSLFMVIDEFLKDSSTRVLRVSLRNLSFAFDSREIIANAIGRQLLTRARHGDFKEKPLFLFLDEAHQFLNKVVSDDNLRHPLDSFELIAKEGRKFSLNICIATQRPRDIPEGVLSQVGTMIVHRLTNEQDRQVVERASGDIDRAAAAFLPILAPGQAVLIGAQLPIPLTVQICRPQQPPESKGPDYQQYWRQPETPEEVTSATDDDVPF